LHFFQDKLDQLRSKYEKLKDESKKAEVKIKLMWHKQIFISVKNLNFFWLFQDKLKRRNLLLEARCEELKKTEKEPTVKYLSF